jgi:uncharacterized membrane protein YbhN (UPF0104 family)
MRQAAKLAAGILLAALLLVWVLHDVDRAALGRALAEASVAGLVLGAILNFAHNVPRVWRWGLLLTPVRLGVPFRPMFSAVLLGYLTTWLVPGRVGEVVRPLLLSGRERIPLGPCLGSVVADRLLDGAAILMLFGSALPFVTFEGPAADHAQGIRATAGVAVIAALLALVALVGVSSVAVPVSRWLAGRPKWVRWVGNATLSVASGSDALRRPALLLAVLAQSVTAWLLICAGTWVGIRASGTDVAFSSVLVLMPLLALGVAVPTPGGAGGYHAAMAWGLEKLFGVPLELAVGAGILMHLAIVIPVFVVGPVLMKTERVSWHDLVSGARQVRGLGAPTGEGART